MLSLQTPRATCFRPWVLACLLTGLAACLSVSPANAGPEGQVRWYTWKSDTFIVHYPVADGNPTDPKTLNAARLALRCGQIADDTLKRLIEVTRVDLPTPIHIILDAHLSYGTHAFAQPEWLKIHVPAQPPPQQLSLPGGDWLEEAIAHELGHLLLAHRASAVPPGTAGLLEAQLGNALVRRPGDEVQDPSTGVQVGAHVPIADSAPFYFVEGGAEFIAELVSANRWSAGRDMLLRTAWLEGLILSPADLQSSLGKTSAELDRAYNQSYAFMRFLQERYGEESFLRVMAAADKQFRIHWNDAVTEGQGIAFEELYARWLEWLEERYHDSKTRFDPDTPEHAPSMGLPLRMTLPEWLSDDEDVKRRWLALPAQERLALRQGRSYQALWPSFSPNGEYLSYWEGGFRLEAAQEKLWPAFGGRPLDKTADRLELGRRARDHAVVPGALPYAHAWSHDSRRIIVAADADRGPFLPPPQEGSRHTGLFVLEVVEKKDQPVALVPVQPGNVIPNTIGALDSAFSPDDRWIAFVRQSNGSANLCLVKSDGSDLRVLTRFADGTQLASPSWSPDGKRIVLEVYRKHERNLWIFDVVRNDFSPLMLDAADDRHPFWAYDGRIYFSSDASGVFNLHSFDPSTLELRRITDVVGGAFMPHVSDQDNVTFLYFDGYAYLPYGMKAGQLLDEPADNSGYFVDATLARSALQGAQEAPAATGSRYRPLEGSVRIAVTPALLLTSTDARGGLMMRYRDPLERHSLNLDVLAGLGHTLHLRYDRSLKQALWRLGGYTYGFQHSGALTSETAGDLLEFERNLSEKALYSRLFLPLTPQLRLDLKADTRASGFLEPATSSDYVDVYESVGGGPSVVFSSFPSDVRHSLRGIDPRGVYFSWDMEVRQSRVFDPITRGKLLEEGEWLGDYVAASTRFNLLFGLPVGRDGRQTLEGRVDAGAIHRNVAFFDELQAGNRFPTLEPADLTSFVAFPGYSCGSLSGETLAVLALALRTPLSDGISASFGPVYLDALYLQAGLTTGNVWGYVESDSGPRRESPLQGGTARNEIGEVTNRTLTEAGLELRIQASLFARFQWSSFLHVGYAFDTVTGLGDVNLDQVYPGEYGDVIPSAGGEIYPAGLRLALGLGTGF